MTKGNDVKHLYSKLGLQPANYKEVRADEEVMHSIEERWPLLRDLLASLARSLDEEPGSVSTVASVAPTQHVMPEQVAPEQSSVEPTRAAAVPAEPQTDLQADAPSVVTSAAPVQTPPVIESAPPAPAWLDKPDEIVESPVMDAPEPVAAPRLSSEPVIEEVSSPASSQSEGVADSGASSGESLADRLERLYGSSAVDEGAAADSEPDIVSSPEVDQSDDYGATPVMHQQEDGSAVGQKSDSGASSSGGLLSRLLSRPSEVKRSEPVVEDVADVAAPVAQTPEVPASSSGVSDGWVMAADDPPPIDLPAESSAPVVADEKPESGVETLGKAHAPVADIQPPPVVPQQTDAGRGAEGEDPELNEIFQRLAPKSVEPKVAPVTTPEPQKRDLQSTFARLKRGV